MKKRQFDAVVVGAGFGGMCAAARLAHEGYKTLVVERLAYLGGRAGSIECRGFKKTTGAHAISGKGHTAETFKAVGAELNLKAGPPDKQCVYWLDGKELLAPVEQAIPQAIQEYSKDKEGARRVLDALTRAMEWQEPTGKTTLVEWFSQYTKDDRIFQVFQPLAIACCQTIYEWQVGEFFALLKDQAKTGGWEISYPTKGNEEIMNSLATVILQKGGEIWKNAEVQRITVDECKATGVIVKTPDNDDEWEIRAPVVVSDTGPKRTVELTGSEHFDKDYLNELKLIKPTNLSITLNIISDEPLSEHVGVIWPVGVAKVGCILPVTNAAPEWAPPGKHMLMVFAFAGMGMFGPAIHPLSIEKEIELTIEDVNKVIPNWQKRGKILSIDTFHGEWPVFRADLNSGYIPVKAPVVGLYNVGDGIRIKGILATGHCAETARIAVDDIVSRFDPTGA